MLQDDDPARRLKGAPYDGDSTDAKAALVQCAGAKDTSSGRAAAAHSQAYNLGQATIVSLATRFKTAADVSDDVALYTNPKFKSCYEQLQRVVGAQALPSGSTVGTVDFSFTSGNNGGTANIAAVGHGTVTLTVAGKTPTTIYQDVVIIVTGLIESEVDFTNIGSAIPADIESRLVAVVADRTAKG